MAANIKEIRDNGPDPVYPTVSEMRESQRKGSEGKGLARQDYCGMQCDFNMYCDGEDHPMTEDDFNPSIDTRPWV